MSPLVAAGESSASPAAAIRIALSSSSGSAPLPRKPEAPARRAWTTYSSTSKVVSMTTRTAASAGSALIMRVAASPSVPGIRMSISTTSGAVVRASSTASAPSAASPTTSMPGSESTSTRNALRSRAWSSASSTLMGASDVPGAPGASGVLAGWVIGAPPSWPPGRAVPVRWCGPLHRWGPRWAGSHGPGTRPRTEVPP